MSHQQDHRGRRGVLFDMDGVLVDTKEFHRQSWHDFGSHYNLPMTDELFVTTFGMQNFEIIPMMAGPLPAEQIRLMSEWKEARYRELIAGHLTLMAGAEDLLEDLSKAGFLLAIGTSTPRINLDFVLQHVPMGKFFHAFVTGEEVQRSKPAPDTFLKAAEKLHLAPSVCVVIEDAVQGVQAGKAGGMRVVAVTTTRLRWELHEADRIVDSLAELKAQDFARLLSD